jgi:NAD(P)-dependent dehydrogenase (short-subunit alcohol dehydrogenase family)
VTPSPQPPSGAATGPATGTLAGRVAIVTGGAGGIGSATVKRMAAEGARVVIADIEAPEIDTVVDAVAESGGLASGFVADVSDADSVREMVAFTVSTYGRLDILHNNAAATSAVGQDSDVVDVDLAIWDEILAVNLTGPMLGCRFAIPEMLKRGGGAIVNTTSVAGLQAEREHVSYGVSKAGLVLLTKHVAVRYGKHGVRCNAIAPGVVVTARTRARRDASWLDAMAKVHNSPRLGDPDDVAQVATFLVSDAAAFVNGAVWTVDGAMTALLPGRDRLLTSGDNSTNPAGD